MNPNGLATTARFECGLTTAYSNTASVTLSPNNGLSVQNVSAAISGLQPGQTYHYRLTATYSGGTVSGVDLTFSTIGVPEIAIEQPPGATISNAGDKDFGVVNVGSHASLTFTIRNTGNADLTGLTVTKDGSHAADFTVTS